VADSQEATMAGDELFGELPEQAKPQTDTAPFAKPRLREPERDQIEWRAVDIESLIGDDHLARMIWAFVEGLDVSELENRIKARGSKAGHPAITPKLMLALWIYATCQGVGSARALARLCESHDAYRWMCGGVSVNHHTLGDFRVECADVLDRLMAEHLAALASAELIDLDTLAQDGVKIRASAGTSSFRRADTLDRLLETAKAVVAHLGAEAKAHPEVSNKRIKAARERAARERVERLEAAQTALAKLKGQRQELEEKGGNGKKQKEPRASTTDADARVMKMADAGFRPAYNVQVTSAAGTQIIIAVDVSNNGSDRRLMKPMLEQLHEQTGRFPKRHIVDGGFCNASGIEWAHSQGIEVFCPPTKSKSGVDPCQPRDDDGQGTLIWRARMASDEGKALYAIRVICECIHARWRNWGLRQVTVRGTEKVRGVAILYAFTNNVLQGFRMVMERQLQLMVEYLWLECRLAAA
jgi:transposase